MMISKFLKNLPIQDNCESRPVIIVQGLGFLFLSVIAMGIALAINNGILKMLDLCPAIYAKALTSTVQNKGLTFTLLAVCLIGPLLEEVIFRLGLSFNKWQVCLGVSVFASCLLKVLLPFSKGSLFEFSSGEFWLLAVPIVLFTLLMRFTKQEQWDSVKVKYGRLLVYMGVILFGLLHLTNFSGVQLYQIPGCLITAMIPMALGATATYFRINLGFLYGLALHVFYNGFCCIGLFTNHI